MRYTKLLAVLITGFIVSSSAFAGPIIPIGNTLPPSGSDWIGFGPVDIGFDINFFGNDYSSLYISNKGYTSFGSAGGYTYNYSYVYQNGVEALIAPFLSDVDNRYAGSPVTYGNITYDNHAAFAVNWVDVDYFPGSTSHTLRNSFQLVLVDRSDIGAGDFDFIFNYDAIQWADNGWGAPFVGYAAQGKLYGFPTDTANGLLTLNSSQLPYNRLNSDVDGRYIFEVRGGVVSPGLPAVPVVPVVPGVPEPETYVMLLAGLGLVVQISRRRRA